MIVERPDEETDERKYGRVQGGKAESEQNPKRKVDPQDDKWQQGVQLLVAQGPPGC